MTASPTIRMEAGRVLCDVPGLGAIELRPSHPNWRKRRAWWRARSAGGKWLTGWHLTAAQAALDAAKTALTTAAIAP